MANKQQVQQQEREENREARATAHRTGNYRFDPFQIGQTVAMRPSNCYGCTWELDPKTLHYRLKFAHKLCYPNHEA